MTAVLKHPSPQPTPPTANHRDQVPLRRRRVWNGFTPLQLVVLTLATIAPVLISGAIGAALLGVISTEAMIEFALAAGENPGMITFGAMFVASPVQWLTGRSQVRVRKYLGIMFFLLALSNAAMFVIETGLASALSAPFLVAGTVAFALAVPLFLTSSRRSQRAMGMKRWRGLHKLTYVIAAALLAHVVLIGEVGPGAVLITFGFIARIPAVRRWLSNRASRGRTRHLTRTSHPPGVIPTPSM
ncbi:MAG: ferric reductase-like transmembrane domain-containing protein [Acidimicrobiales bacterium]